MPNDRPTSSTTIAGPGGDAPGEQLVAELSPQLYRYALVRLGRADLADDAVAETFCRLIEKGPPLERPTAHVHGWCVRCLVNVCRETARRRKTTSIETGQVKVDSGYRLADWQKGLTEETRMLVLAMGCLSERQHEAVTLRVLMGLQVTVVASIMDCAEGTVKALTHQGVASLRREVLRCAETGEAG